VALQASSSGSSRRLNSSQLLLPKLSHQEASVSEGCESFFHLRYEFVVAPLSCFMPRPYLSILPPFLLAPNGTVSIQLSNLSSGFYLIRDLRMTPNRVLRANFVPCYCPPTLPPPPPFYVPCCFEPGVITIWFPSFFPPPQCLFPERLRPSFKADRWFLLPLSLF